MDSILWDKKKCPRSSTWRRSNAHLFSTTHPLMKTKAKSSPSLHPTVQMLPLPPIPINGSTLSTYSAASPSLYARASTLLKKQSLPPIRFGEILLQTQLNRLLNWVGGWFLQTGFWSSSNFKISESEKFPCLMTVNDFSRWRWRSIPIYKSLSMVRCDTSRFCHAIFSI